MNPAALSGDQGVTGAAVASGSFGNCVMARILTFSGHAAAWLPRPFVLLRSVFGGFWAELTRDAVRPYRPELHYMRGPGPAWHRKHGKPHER